MASIKLAVYMVSFISTIGIDAAPTAHRHLVNHIKLMHTHQHAASAPHIDQESQGSKAAASQQVDAITESTEGATNKLEIRASVDDFGIIAE